jgi:hypothetical protein
MPKAGLATGFLAGRRSPFRRAIDKPQRIMITAHSGGSGARQSRIGLEGKYAMANSPLEMH